MTLRVFSRVLAVVLLLALVVPSQPQPAQAAVQSWTGYVNTSGTKWVAHKFRVEASSSVKAVLKWGNTANLNLHLKNPAGTTVATSTNTSGSSEQISHVAKTTGTWTLGVLATSGAASYTLTADVGSTTTTTPTTTTTGGTRRGWTVENESSSHGWTEAQAVEDARLVDYIVALAGSYRGKTAKMYAANPSLLLVNYMNGTLASGSERDAFPDSWYLKDRYGRKIRNDWGLWLMDPNNSSWGANRAQLCLKYISANGYRGCSLDNMGYGTILPSALGGARPINKSTGQPYTDAQWLAHTTKLATQIRSKVSPKVVTINGLMYGQAYLNGSRQLLNAVDAGTAEIFVRTSRQGINHYRSVQQWKADVDMLVDAGNRGKRVFTITKVWISATQAQKNAWHEYALATFLLGDNGRHRFTFSENRYEDATKAHPWWSVDLGAPQGGYVQAGGVYKRAYAKGLVLANPTGTATTVKLPAAMRDLYGTVRTSVSLPAHTGRVLRY